MALSALALAALPLLARACAPAGLCALALIAAALALALAPVWGAGPPGRIDGPERGGTPRMEAAPRSLWASGPPIPAPSGPPGARRAPDHPAARALGRAESTPSRLVSSLNCDLCGRESLRWSELIECSACRRDSCERCTAWVDRSGLRFCSEECAASYTPSPERAWCPDEPSDSEELEGPGWGAAGGPGAAGAREWERGP